ncbi:hypothetical protein CJO94_18210 (plasmid) [Ralstonia solanacearum]|nr:hypothetical protein CJO94_18210 [Ralstonia solanacearum]
MVKISENEAVEALSSIVAAVPALELGEWSSELSSGRTLFDFVLEVSASGRERHLVCAVTDNGQPRMVRQRVWPLLQALATRGSNATAVLIAPYLSPEARAICVDHHVGYLDMEGNCRIAFDGVYIERAVPTKPAAERRELKSLFKPKAAQILRVLLREPGHRWRGTDLAEQADVSVGLVSNVRKALIAKEWAEAAEQGLTLTRPDALLDAWQASYEPPPGERLTFYTPLHGAAFDEAAKHAFAEPADVLSHAMLGSYSAARWLAPFAKSGTQYLYADAVGLQRLIKHCKLKPASSGPNVEVCLLVDDGLFRDVDLPAPGIVTTGPVQTYLDLMVSGERGQEAAAFLRETKLRWKE